MLFGDGGEFRHWGVHLCQGLLGGAELAEAAIDQDQVRPEFLASEDAGVSAADDFLYAGTVIDALDGLDAETAIAALKRPSVDKLNQRADGFAPGKMGDIETLDGPDRLIGFEDLLQFRQRLGRIAGKDFRLNVALDGPAAVEPLDQPDPVATEGRSLIVKGRRSLVHLLFELPKHHRPFRLHKPNQIADDPLILGLPDPPGARGGTLLDTVEKAGPKELSLVVIVADVKVAGAKLEYLLEDHQHRPQVLNAGKRAEEPAAGTFGVAGDIDAGKIRPRRDLQIRKRLIVDKVGIVGRADILYQPGLLQDGVDLAFGFEIVNGLNFGDHLDDLGAA